MKKKRLLQEAEELMVGGEDLPPEVIAQALAILIQSMARAGGQMVAGARRARRMLEEGMEEE